MKTHKRRHPKVRSFLFTKDGERKILKQLRTMKKAIKEGYSVACVTNAQILKAKRKDDLYKVI